VSPGLFQFEEFELDCARFELRRKGRSVRLEKIPMELLQLLAESEGRLVTREEIEEHLWGKDVFVDAEHGINTAVRKIRQVLEDDPDAPRFVLTVPRKGYRFIAQVSRTEGRLNGGGEGPAAIARDLEGLPSEATYSHVLPATGSSPSGSVGTARQRSIPRAFWLVAAATIVVWFGYKVVQKIFNRDHPDSVENRTISDPERPQLRPIPFTALPGIETAAAFSPDGSRVAFAWREEGAKGFDLYVKAIGSETLLRLTQRPSEWISPTWSPDGTQIAFHRMAGADTGIYVVPALGGPERKLRSTRVPYAVASPISWSPDGRWIAFSEPAADKAEDRMFLLSTQTLATTAIAHDPRCLHEADPTFSHSGKEIAHLCVHTTEDFEIDTMPASGGARQLAVRFSGWPSTLAWSADDTRLVFSQVEESQPTLFEVRLSDRTVTHLTYTKNAEWVAVSPKGDRLLYSMDSANINIWRKDLLHPSNPPKKLIVSTQMEEDAHYSPDGKHIAFQSTRAGSLDIWTADAEGKNLERISNLTGDAHSPRWSPDGTKLAFDRYYAGHFEVYIVDVTERVPKKLQTDVQEISAPNWSRDGEWIYFRSYEGRGHRIYRCPAKGGNATLMGGFPDGTFPQESADQKTLYFAARNVNTEIERISLIGNSGKVFAVEGLPRVDNETAWTVVPEGIFFIPAEAERSIRYFDSSTREIREVLTSNTDLAHGLSVSPDGRYLLFAQVDRENSDIMMVENFH